MRLTQRSAGTDVICQIYGNVWLRCLVSAWLVSATVAFTNWCIEWLFRSSPNRTLKISQVKRQNGLIAINWHRSNMQLRKGQVGEIYQLSHFSTRWFFPYFFNIHLMLMEVEGSSSTKSATNPRTLVPEGFEAQSQVEISARSMTGSDQMRENSTPSTDWRNWMDEKKSTTRRRRCIQVDVTCGWSRLRNCHGQGAGAAKLHEGFSMLVPDIHCDSVAVSIYRPSSLYLEYASSFESDWIFRWPICSVPVQRHCKIHRTQRYVWRCALRTSVLKTNMWASQSRSTIGLDCLQDRERGGRRCNSSFPKNISAA